MTVGTRLLHKCGNDPLSKELEDQWQQLDTCGPRDPLQLETLEGGRECASGTSRCRAGVSVAQSIR